MDAQQNGLTAAVQAVDAEVHRALEGIDSTAFDAFCRLFDDHGRRWFFSGQGRSGLVAEMAAMRFMHLGFNTHFLGEATAPAVRAGDGLLLVSSSGKTPVTIAFAQRARSEGAMIAVLTSDLSSPLARNADAAVEVPSAGSHQFGGSLFEQASLLLLDAAVLQIAGKDPETHTRMAARHTNMQ